VQKPAFDSHALVALQQGRKHKSGLRTTQGEPKNEMRARTHPLARKHYTLKSFLMECRWKTCYAATPMPRLKARFLELAKGIEPPTL
jgi:hypothetical protein